MKMHPVTARMIGAHPQGAIDYLRQIVLLNNRRAGITFQNEDLASGDILRIHAPDLPPHTGELRNGMLAAKIDLGTNDHNGYLGFHTGLWNREDRLPRVVIDGELPDRNPEELAGRPIETVVAHPLLEGQVIASDRPIVTEREDGPIGHVVTFIPLVDVPWTNMPLPLSLHAQATLRDLRGMTARPSWRTTFRAT